MNRKQWLATDAMRDLANMIRRDCRGTEYKYSAASPVKHAGHSVEWGEFSGIYTCHTCRVQGVN